MISLSRLFSEAKNQQRPLAMIALYDAPTAQLACDANADVLLVGDSMGNVVLGFDNTLSVAVDDIARATGAVVRGVKSSTRSDVPVVADMPFASYATVADAVSNAARLMREGAHGVKLEGAGQSALAAIRALVESGVPVVGHLGFTPQSALSLRGVVQGKTADAARKLLDDALNLQNAGAIALVLEAIPSAVAQVVTERLDISTIGIGAGNLCDAQVLVWHDLVGFSSGAPFRFVKRYAQAREILLDATRQFVAETHAQSFPDASHEYSMSDEELALWRKE